MKNLNLNLLQWNCRSLSSKYVEFSNIANDYEIICVQETWLDHRDTISLRNFVIFRNDRDRGNLGGGTAVLCKESLDPTRICINFPIDTGLEFTIIKINSISLQSKKIIVASIYRPPDKVINNKTWKSFFNCLSTLLDDHHLVICGDLNAQHSAWGSSRPNPSGKILVGLINQLSLNILNTGVGTRISANEMHVSVPDITLATPAIANISNWSVGDDSMESDHLPITLWMCWSGEVQKHNSFYRPKICLNKFDKKTFSEKVAKEIEKFHTSCSPSTGADLYNELHEMFLNQCFRAGGCCIDNLENHTVFDKDKNELVVEKRTSGLNKQTKVNNL